MIKVALTGTHGTGKTTAAGQLAARLAEEFPGLKIAQVGEVARQCPMPINQATTPEAQQWLFHTQIAAELAAGATNPDIIICDRCGLDNLVYAWTAMAKAEMDGDPAGWGFLEEALYYFRVTWLATYSLVFWLRPSYPLANDGVRDTDPHFQDVVDFGFSHLIATINLPGFFKPWNGLGEAMWRIKAVIDATRGQ